MTYLIDGTTPLPANGDTGWGSTLNTAISSIDSRFTYSAPNYGLAATVLSSSLTSVGTLTSLAVSGSATVGGNLTITGNVTINGTTTTINSTTLSTDDIILTLGGDTAPTADDNKDRGVEFRWHDGAASRVGFFGYDDSTGKFTFIPNATNTVNVFSGTLGTIDVGAVHINGSQIAASDLSNGTTGSGSVVLATSPTLTTPTIGVATATSVNKVAITAPATSATLTIADGKTLTASNTLTFTGTDSSSVAFGTGGTVAYTANKLSAFASTTSSELAGVISDETGSGSLVFGTGPTLSQPVIDNPRLGYATTATAAGSTTLVATSGYRQYFTGTTTQTVVLPVTSTMALGQAFEIHNNSTGIVTVNSSGGNLVASVDGGRTAIITCILTSGTTAASWDADFTGSSTTTGTGAAVFATSPTLTTPTIGVATATSVNRVAITAPATSATLTIADGKTLTASNTLTLTGTDSSSVAFGAGGTVAYVASPTFTGQVTVPAGTTSAAPIIFQSGSVLTSAAGGRMEYDGNVFYLTPSSTAVGGRGIAETSHYYALSSPRTLSDVNTAQSILGVSLTVQGSTTYEFEMMFSVSTSGATSNSLGIGFGGTATLTSIAYQVNAAQNATSAATLTAPNNAFVAAATNTTITSAVATATFRNIWVKGVVRINVSGTFTPQLTYSAAPGAAPSVAANSFIKMTPIGTNTVTTVGAWA